MSRSTVRFSCLIILALLTLTACGGGGGDNSGDGESEGDSGSATDGGDSTEDDSSGTEDGGTDDSLDAGDGSETATGASFSWDIPAPSPESRIVYVSSDGDDSDARVYSSSAVEVGANPMQPARDVRAFASIAAACEQLRNGQPDWILLRRGDSWNDAKQCARSGSGPDRHFVFGAYGEGARPRILAGPDESVINVVNSRLEHFTITDLELYSYTSDPNNPEYIEGSHGGTGIRLCCGAMVSDIVLQNLRIAYFDEALIIQKTGDSPTGSFEDITLRGSTIERSYALGPDGGGHSSGAFLAGIKGLTLEGNTLDHNGWLIQNDGNAGSGSGGRATYFNHNVYISSGEDIEIRNNLFSRASSIGIKFRSDEPGKLEDVTIQDNLFVDGEIGLSIGGNSYSEHRFVNFSVKDNVFFRIGRSQPTGRTLSWGLDVQDWDGGTIEGNIFARQDLEELGNTYAIRLKAGSTRDTVVRDNIVYDVDGGNNALIQLGDVAGPVTFAGNTVAVPSYESLLASAPPNGGAIDFSGNRYSGMAARDRWFEINNMEVGADVWQGETGADSVATEMPEWADARRTISSYIDGVKGTDGSSFDDLFAEVLQQRKGNWDPRFEASAINEYLRDGFAVTNATGSDDDNGADGGDGGDGESDGDSGSVTDGGDGTEDGSSGTDDGGTDGGDSTDDGSSGTDDSGSDDSGSATDGDDSTVASCLEPGQRGDSTDTAMPELKSAGDPGHADGSTKDNEHMAALGLVAHDSATHAAVRDGAWCNPATWHNATIPGPDADVVIPEDRHVTYGLTADAALRTVRVVNGHLF